MTRRELLKIALFVSIEALIIFPHEKARAGLVENQYCGKLDIYNQNTQESLTLEYLTKDGQFDTDACRQLDRLFRCPYTHLTAPIDPKLFLLLDRVQCSLGATNRPYILRSGYRSAKYNKMLKKHDHAVAKASYHMRGMAADISMEGVSLRDIQRVSQNLELGGVGVYADFIHLDVGPVRTW